MLIRIIQYKMSKYCQQRSSSFFFLPPTKLPLNDKRNRHYHNCTSNQVEIQVDCFSRCLIKLENSGNQLVIKSKSSNEKRKVVCDL